jgi:hypothetical protein
MATTTSTKPLPTARETGDRGGSRARLAGVAARCLAAQPPGHIVWCAREDLRQIRNLRKRLVEVEARLAAIRAEPS